MLTRLHTSILVGLRASTKISSLTQLLLCWQENLVARLEHAAAPPLNNININNNNKSSAKQLDSTSQSTCYVVAAYKSSSSSSSSTRHEAALVDGARRRSCRLLPRRSGRLRQLQVPAHALAKERATRAKQTRQAERVHEVAAPIKLQRRPTHHCSEDVSDNE